MRWSELHNSYEGVGEEQAIGYFTDGCRDGTLMKHKLNRTEPKTMTEFMAIADKYATGNFVARVQFTTTTVTAIARGRTSAMKTSMARSKWPLSKEARGLRAAARGARESSSTKTNTPSR
jgi:hypothetical protein